MTSLRTLRNQKRTVLEGMADTKNNISSVEDKISRLRTASSQMASSISELETIKSSIDGLTIDAGRWKGKKENEFQETYSDYKDNVKNFVSKTEKAKEAMDDDIRRYEADKTSYTIGLNNLEGTLDSLDAQITQEAKG